MRLPLEELDDCIAFSWLEPRVKLHYWRRFLVSDKRQLPSGILSFPCPDGFVVLLGVMSASASAAVVDSFRLRNHFHLLPRNMALALRC